MLLPILAAITRGIYRRRHGGGYPKREELDALIEREVAYRESKKRRQKEKLTEAQELQETIEIAFLKAKGLWVEPTELIPQLPPELTEILKQPLDPKIIGELQNLRTRDEDDIEMLLLMS